MNDVPNLEISKSTESKHNSWGVLDIKRMFDEGNLIVQEDFQRMDVWDNSRKSRLIESLLLGIPIPSIYVEEVEEGRYTVIDGQQRINSIIRYLNGEFGLSGSSVVEKLKNKRYKDIKVTSVLITRFHNEKIPVIIITSENKEIKYEIFERLNTGAVKLNNQELRNCMYHGDYNDLIKNELSVNTDFEYLLGSSYKQHHRRMKDAELVLRFFAFTDTYEEDYKPPMKRFLNGAMESPDGGIKKLNDNQIEEFKNIFEKCIRLVKEVFDKNAFRTFDVGSDKEVNGKWNKQLNTALFDVEMCGFAPYVKGSKWGNENVIVQCKDAIYEELIYMMTQEKGFIYGIGNRNYEKDKVRCRFRKWETALHNITENQGNNFSLKTKKKIYKNNPDCCICGKIIQDTDDAEVYGVKYYWRGETIPINSRLAHRYCNSQVMHTSPP